MNLLPILVAAALIAAAAVQAQSNNAQWGNTSWDSALAFNLPVEKGSRLLQTVEERITYPPKGVINTRPIQAIRAYDQKTNGNGATASIVAGGINQTTVTVLFKSKRGHGIHFKLEVYTPSCK